MEGSEKPQNLSGVSEYQTGGDRPSTALSQALDGPSVPDLEAHMAEREAAWAWRPYEPCICGCGQRHAKQKQKSGHVVGCKCRPCLGKRNRKKGQAAQAKGHRALGGTGFTPGNEESVGGYEIRVQVEHKAGAQVPKAFHKFLATEWFRRALSQAERAVRVGDMSHPAVMIDGRWLVVDMQKGVKGG